MENLEELKKLLNTPQDVVILTHRNPDGDAVGSSLGLSLFLQKNGHNVKIVAPSDYPDFLSWMPQANDIVIYDHDPEEVEHIVKRATLIFCLDFNSLDRIDKAGELVEDARCPKVMIDHHLFPEPFADFMLSETTASSTCELVYDFIHMLGQEDYLDQMIGECLFTGILTDTGSFKYSNSPKLFRTVANLLEMGVDDLRLQDLIFNSMNEKQLRILGHCLYNRLEILPEYQTGIITLTKEDYSFFDINRGDTEGVVNFLLKLRNVKLAAFIHEQPKIVKLSLRSKGDIDVQEMAKRNFRGGGHKNAAGGASFHSLAVTVRRFKEILEENKEQLQS
ncbi:DHH family phosphoesterase [Lewinella cohaerens]|uniref:DHH family phosphoesterase n=1 Tax=Lewinella cohaerens TaxID=70995 RepID=UPI00036462D1|nr:bifunctional oligoribonuclease/PAP phosphatase NrnA [Lewinella cohaerens]